MPTSFDDGRRVQDTDKLDNAVKVQYLPFKIEYDGKADVDQNFTSEARSNAFPDDAESLEKVMRNQFRGRPLAGSEIKLPESYSGIVVTEKRAADIQDDGKTEKTLELISNFDAFTYWNWDQPPSAMDSPRKLMDMLELAQILHSPLDCEAGRVKEDNNSNGK